jgi:hypothetical protein
VPPKPSKAPAPRTRKPRASKPPEVRARAEEPVEPTFAEKKKALAADLLVDAAVLRTQLFAPCVEVKAMVVSDGGSKDFNEGSHVEIVNLERTEPTFAEKKYLAGAIAILVDKALELQGNATAEGTVVDELKAQRDKRRGTARRGADAGPAPAAGRRGQQRS